MHWANASVEAYALPDGFMRCKHVSLLTPKRKPIADTAPHTNRSNIDFIYIVEASYIQRAIAYVPTTACLLASSLHAVVPLYADYAVVRQLVLDSAITAGLLASSLMQSCPYMLTTQPINLCFP